MNMTGHIEPVMFFIQRGPHTSFWISDITVYLLSVFSFAF